MNGHPQPEDLDLLALGALDPTERQSAEAHVRACVECQRRLEEARGRLALLSLSAPEQTPSPRARQQLLDRIRFTLSPAQRDEGPARATVPVSGFRAWLQQASLTFAVASLVLFASTVWLGYVNRELFRLNDNLRGQIATLHESAERQRQETARTRAVMDVLSAPDAVRVTLVAAQARPLPQGRAFYHSRKGLVFTASNLRPLPAGKTYQLWLIPTEGNPISAGVFDPDAQGSGAVLLPPLPEGVAAKAFAVTVEPAGGVPQPTGPIVLLGSAS
ncbi:MAG: anti-sigma factor [Candidatus Acidiferrales bacterium]